MAAHITCMKCWHDLTTVWLRRWPPIMPVPRGWKNIKACPLTMRPMVMFRAKYRISIARNWPSLQPRNLLSTALQKKRRRPVILPLPQITAGMRRRRPLQIRSLDSSPHMKKKQALFLVVVAAVLAFLVYLQVQHWRRFDWGKFAEQTNQVRWGMVVAGIAMIYLADALRAWRWAIFLRPVRKVEAHTLIGTQFIGFTGLALLGRLGELIRPYLVARKFKLSFSSQRALWSLERIFDTGAVAVLTSFALFSSSSVKHLEHYQQLPKIGIALVVFVLGGIVVAYLVRRFNALIAQWIKSAFHRFPSLGERLAGRVVAFGEGLHTLHDAPSFFASAALSLTIWILVSFSYLLITHAYPAPFNALT